MWGFRVFPAVGIGLDVKQKKFGGFIREGPVVNGFGYPKLYKPDFWEGAN